MSKLLLLLHPDPEGGMKGAERGNISRGQFREGEEKREANEMQRMREGALLGRLGRSTVVASLVNKANNHQTSSNPAPPLKDSNTGLG